jgi:hypothetical protein
MTTPGFTAEHALGVRPAAGSGVPVILAGGAPSAERIIPQAVHWGSFSTYKCVGPGISATSAIIWGIPWGQSWLNTCASTPGQPSGFSHPVDPYACCTEYVAGIAVNEWGYWLLPDAKCPPGDYPTPCWVTQRGD